MELRCIKEKIIRETRALEKAEADKEDIVLQQARHELKLCQEREILEQQLKFQKALESSRQS